MASLVERLRALYVWPQSVADHYPDILTPRQVKQLYEVGFAADEAADRITALEAMCETLAGALEEVKSSMLNGGDGQDGDFGWNITKLNRSRATIREALTQYRAMKEKNDG